MIYFYQINQFDNFNSSDHIQFSFFEIIVCMCDCECAVLNARIPKTQQQKQEQEQKQHRNLFSKWIDSNETKRKQTNLHTVRFRAGQPFSWAVNWTTKLYNVQFVLACLLLFSLQLLLLSGRFFCDDTHTHSCENIILKQKIQPISKYVNNLQRQQQWKELLKAVKW